MYDFNADIRYKLFLIKFKLAKRNDSLKYSDSNRNTKIRIFIILYKKNHNEYKQNIIKFKFKN